MGGYIGPESYSLSERPKEIELPILELKVSIILEIVLKAPIGTTKLQRHFTNVV